MHTTPWTHESFKLMLNDVMKNHKAVDPDSTMYIWMSKVLDSVVSPSSHFPLFVTKVQSNFSYDIGPNAQYDLEMVYGPVVVHARFHVKDQGFTVAQVDVDLGSKSYTSYETFTVDKDKHGKLYKSASYSSLFETPLYQSKGYRRDPGYKCEKCYDRGAYFREEKVGKFYESILTPCSCGGRPKAVW